jgi:hypothetical protein
MCRAQDSDLGMALEVLHLTRQTVWQGNVVRVQQSEVFATGSKAAGVSSLRQVAVGYHMKLYAVVLCLIASDDRLRSVGRAKIDNDEFKVSKRLVEDALDRFSQKALDVAYNHGYRD